jgi:hypothetical protein
MKLTPSRVVFGMILLVLSLLCVWIAVPIQRELTFREKLVRELAKEDIRTTVESLPDFQDVMWVYGSFPDGPGITGSYLYGRNLSPRVNRVRKLLHMAESSRDELVPLIESKIDAYACNLQAAKEELARLHPDGVVKQAGEYHKKIWYTTFGVYLLAELRSYRSLPLLAKVYLREPGELLPVSRTFLWYAMHLLVLEHPRENLSSQAKQALDAYLQETREVPLPRTLEVTAWNAAVEESDPRVVVGKIDIGVARQPQIKVREYPYKIVDLEDGIVGVHMTNTGKKYFASMKKFIDLAYPEAK